MAFGVGGGGGGRGIGSASHQTPCAAKYYHDAPWAFDDDGAATIHFPDKSLLSMEGKVAQRARALLHQWNAAALSGAPHVELNPSIPMEEVVGRFSSTALQHQRGRHFLVSARLPASAEPLKVNSNSGWALGGGGGGGAVPKWAEALQALSHFSYEVSGGESLLCNLTGAEVGGRVVLTDVAICSRGQTCGPTDLGADGIANFFGHHVCGPLCAAHRWRRPRDAAQLYPAVHETVVVEPRALPSRLMPGGAYQKQPHPRGGAAGGEYVVDEASILEESLAWRAEAHEQRAMEDAAARCMAADATRAAAAAALPASSSSLLGHIAAPLRPGQGINGINGVIGRQATTQSRQTVQELLFREPQGWRKLDKLADMMAAPNTGEYYTEPAPEPGSPDGGEEEEEGGGVVRQGNG